MLNLVKKHSFSGKVKTCGNIATPLMTSRIISERRWKGILFMKRVCRKLCLMGIIYHKYFHLRIAKRKLYSWVCNKIYIKTTFMVLIFYGGLWLVLYYSCAAKLVTLGYTLSWLSETIAWILWVSGLVTRKNVMIADEKI